MARSTATASWPLWRLLSLSPLAPLLPLPPLLLALLVVALAGLVVPRRSHAVDTRPLILLTMVVGLGLAVAPSITAEFVWRYQMPLVLLLPMSAALALTRLAGQPGTTAAPSTDWPNGGVNRLSRNRVVGTSNRS